MVHSVVNNSGLSSAELKNSTLRYECDENVFRTSMVRNFISRGVKMRISARAACVRPHFHTRSEIKIIFNFFFQFHNFFLIGGGGGGISTTLFHIVVDFPKILGSHWKKKLIQ